MNAISVRELEPMLEMIEELEEEFDKKAYIDKFVTIKLENGHDSMLGQLKGMTENSELIEKIKEKEVELNQHYSIYTIISKIVRERGWSTEDEEFLASHSVDEIYEFLIADDHEDLLKTVIGAKSIFSKKDGDQPRDIFGGNLHKALIKLAKRSALDDYRIRHYFGIDTTEPDNSKVEQE